MTELTADQRKEEIESSIAAIIELLQGDDMNESYGDMLSEANEEEYKAVQQFFADFDSSWKTHISPVIEAILDRRIRAKRAQEYSLLYASPKGGQADTNMTPAPITTGTQTQMQVQRTIPEPVSPSQADWLINRFHYRPDVVAKMSKTEAAAKLDELWKRENGG